MALLTVRVVYQIYEECKRLQFHFAIVEHLLLAAEERIRIFFSPAVEGSGEVAVFELR